ncbi:MAG: peptide chain release factor N(5)-glutamine methyltransferase [Ectothiorhodospiraceae bacterium]|nr:peptide chain release factor N(5)-glutamine methyltransferase [Ectothiorhodospiraceae bacterium]
MSLTLPTIASALRNARTLLEVSSESALLDAEILMGHAINRNRAYLRTWPEKALSAPQWEQFQHSIQRRGNGEPIAYITGKRDFWDMTLMVSPDTLIPRPETETLVEQALAKIPHDARWQIADLGTGSGAIALAIARERPRCHLTATDISPSALAIARTNAKQLNTTNIRFIEGAWFAPLSGDRFEIVVSNPPYIHPDDPHLQRGDLRFEPVSALQSGTDGMADIRNICDLARQHLQPGGWLLLEHGFEQGPATRTILDNLGYQQVETLNDLANNPRVSLGRWAQ